MSVKREILLASNEERLRLASFLERAGFTVSSEIIDGEELLSIAANKYHDLMVLDTMLPNIGGRMIVQYLRNMGNWTPIILLTDVENAIEKATSLEEGADDCISKPVEPYELLARVRAILRRTNNIQRKSSEDKRLKSGNLIIDPSSRRIWLDYQEIAITPKAFALLEYLMKHPDKLIRREQLLEIIWGWDHMITTRAVDARISEIRRALNCNKLSSQFIETVIGEGYRFTGHIEVD